jgi:hypothetical protein
LCHKQRNKIAVCRECHLITNRKWSSETAAGNVI